MELKSKDPWTIFSPFFKQVEAPARTILLQEGVPIARNILSEHNYEPFVIERVNAWRPLQMTERTIKSIFKKQQYYFKASPYVATQLKIVLRIMN